MARLLGLETQQIGKKPRDVPGRGHPADKAQIGLRRGTRGEQPAHWLLETGIAEIRQPGLPPRPLDQRFGEQGPA